MHSFIFYYDHHTFAKHRRIEREGRSPHSRVTAVRTETLQCLVAQAQKGTCLGRYCPRVLTGGRSFANMEPPFIILWNQPYCVSKHQGSAAGLSHKDSIESICKTKTGDNNWDVVILRELRTEVLVMACKFIDRCHHFFVGRQERRSEAYPAFFLAKTSRRDHAYTRFFE
jgi:hypothetical protein